MENENIINKERSELSLEGGKKPLSLYTRRVINPEKINDYLNKASAKGLCGTQNLGNTCYMNSSITSLINCKELIYYFLKGDYKKDINDNKEFVEKVYELFKNFWVDQINVVNPEDFKDIIGEQYPQFKGYDQQDANEFLTSTFNLLNESLKAINIDENKDNKEIIIVIDNNEPDEEASKQYWNRYLKLNDSIITDLFCGQLKQIINCPECGEVKRNFDFFNILNLPIAKNEKNYIYNFQYFYVPKYAIRRAVHIYYKKYRNDATFADCFKKLKKEENFVYKDKININKLIINKIFNKKSQGFIEDNIPLMDCNKDRTYYFCYDLLNEEENIKIPLYLKREDLQKEEGILAQYPRMIFLSQKNTLDDLRLKIYYLIRKYIFSPLKEENIEADPLTIDIVKYIKDKKVDDEIIINSIKEEYKECFKSENKNKNVELFIKNLPFTIFLVNNNNDNDKIVFTSNFIELSEDIKEKAKINNFNDSIENLLELLKKYSFQIEFTSNYDYINQYNFNFNIATKCNCSYIYDEDENMNRLTMEDCLKSFIKEEELKQGLEYDCSKCNKKVLAKKKIELYYLPKIFIICFKRFIKNNEDIWSKNEEEINFPIENLDMKEYMIGPDKEHSKYDLFALIQHYGTIENGHYISICKNGDNWHKYDDSQVSNFDINNAQNSYAYILFYRRQTD